MLGYQGHRGLNGSGEYLGRGPMRICCQCSIPSYHDNFKMTVPDIEAISTNLLICAFNMHLCWREISRCGQKRQTCIFKGTKAPVCYRLRPVSQTCPLYFKCHFQCYIMALLKDNTAYHTLAHTFITEHRSTFHIRCWKSIPDD